MSVEDPGQANSVFQIFHNVWSTVLTGVGLLLMWNGRRLVKELDAKARQKDFADHKAEVDKRFTEMQTEIHRMIDQQAKQHEQNTSRLDTILLEISRGRGRSS